MITNKTIIALFAGITICAAQTIDIQGTVIDSAGRGISDATVELKETDISTKTNSDGSFTLSGIITSIQAPGNAISKGKSSIRFKNGNLELSLSRDSRVSLSVFNIEGRKIFSSSKNCKTGRHLFTIPAQAAGIHLFRFTIGTESLSFKALPFSTSPISFEKVTTSSVKSAKQAKTTAAFSDVLCITSDGQLNYTDSIRTPDTSGIVVRMIPCAGVVTDADGNEYQCVKIGNQIWTVENLRTTKYNDGTPVPHVVDHAEWAELSTGAFCYYENDLAAMEKYGALYNWYAVISGNLAPEGWRVPVDEDWDTLLHYLKDNGYAWEGAASEYEFVKSMAARTDWRHSDTLGTPGNDPSSNNSSGLSFLAAGSRNSTGIYYGQGIDCYQWSASEVSTSYAHSATMYYNNLYISTVGLGLQNGFSVRLIFGEE